MCISAERPFSRLEFLVGPKCLDAFRNARVIVFGVGGVGSWCAEGLVRSGIGRLTVVDSDAVSVSNINRQLQATPLSIGKPKAEEIGRRLREINPDAEIIALHKVYNRDNREEFGLGGYDYVIDAIDSLSSKVDLIMAASAAGATVFSSLGAACRVDPARVRASSIWKSDKCRLGRFVRKKLRRRGFKGDFLCVWSDEDGGNFGDNAECGMRNAECVSVDDDIDIDNNTEADINDYHPLNDNINNNQPTNKTINGSLVAVTGVFGFMLSGLVIQDIINKSNNTTIP
jgi:tRNA A37 threonylcarbamoyladenosine dehydratase